VHIPEGQSGGSCERALCDGEFGALKNKEE
jgi:hypothetical protein